MQNYTTIIGVIEMRSKEVSMNKCCDRFKIGKGTVALIMKRYQALELSLADLKQMEADKVEAAFYPPEIRGIRKYLFRITN